MKSQSDFTLLFADDDPGIRAIYLKAFTAEGYQVKICDSAAQILAELKEGKADLLVTDLEMPKSNTLDIFPVLKENYPRLPVIVVTGHYRGLKEDFLSRGYNITALLHKPTGISTLKKTIEEILKIAVPANGKK
jgi:DNA-binding NtrC family response regulator